MMGCVVFFHSPGATGAILFVLGTTRHPSRWCDGRYNGGVGRHRTVGMGRKTHERSSLLFLKLLNKTSWLLSIAGFFLFSCRADGMRSLVNSEGAVIEFSRKPKTHRQKAKIRTNPRLSSRFCLFCGAKKTGKNQPGAAPNFCL